MCMEVSYREHAMLGPGHGFFVLHGEAADAGAFRLFLQRSMDQKFLSNEGEWLETQQAITIHREPAEETTSDLWLPLRPELVNALNTTDIYRMTLYAEGREEPYRATVRIQEIRYSPEATLKNTIDLETPKKKAVVPPVQDVS